MRRADRLFRLVQLLRARRFATGEQIAGELGVSKRTVYRDVADLQGSGANDTFAPWKFSNPWFGTLRARAGMAAGNSLFYGTIGLAYGTLKLQNVLTGVSESHTGIGWAGGVGAEVGMVANWTAKVEYLYVNLDRSPFVLTGASHGITSNTLRLGVNYRF